MIIQAIVGTRLRHPQVILEISRETPAPDVLIYGRHVAQQMKGNKWVTDPFIPISVLEGDLDLLEAAEVEVKSRGMGLAAIRDFKLAVVFTDLEVLRASVQRVCDANPGDVVAIAETCGMTLKGYTRPPKPPLAVSRIARGTVKLMAKAVKRGATYEWAFSADDGETWVSAGMTNGIADTTVAGLTVGTTYLFRVRASIGRITGAWVAPVSLYVH
jgi:hypothetical protein